MVVLLLANLFPTSVIALRAAESRNRATLIADGILTKQMALPYSDLIPGPPVTLPEVKDSGTTYTPTLEVFTISGRNPDYLKGLRVVVAWTDREKNQEVRQEVWVPNARR